MNRKHFTALLLLVLVFALTGCAAIQGAKSAYDACIHDPTKECPQKVTAWQNTTAAVVQAGTAMIPNPAIAAASPVAGSAAGKLAAIIAAIIFGNALLKKKDQDPNAKG